MSEVNFLSAFIKRTDGIKNPELINIDDPEKGENESYLSLISSISNLLDFDNLVILAGSGTSLTFQGIAPSMGQLWEKCKEQDPDKFQDVLDAVKYDENQKKRDSKTNEPWNDIELLLSLCDQYIALFPNAAKTGELTSFLINPKQLS
tara:strand:+ start:3310 stop:3753 length:444 start_codon:yes stop_codon:yes gene_type:complete